MPSLTRKIVQGRPYYYVRHCQQVDGQPRIVKTDDWLKALWWQAHALDKRNAPFPLTPALSLGERENRRPRVEQSRPLGLVERRDAWLPLLGERAGVRGN